MIIDNIEYTFRQANFIEARDNFLKLAGIAKGGIEQIDGKMSIDFGKIISNIGNPEMLSVANFIIKYTEAKNEQGENIQLNKPDVFNNHFNAHRDHYFQVLIEGAKFHFLGFIPAGLVSGLSTDSLIALATA